MTEEDKNLASRRLFLAKAGRFAAITPPAIALMLSTTGAAHAQPTSGVTTTVTTSTTDTTSTSETTSTTTTLTTT